jgi:hypothetical protein
MPEGVDDALLADLRQRSRVRGVAHALVPLQLVPQRIDGVFVLGHRVRPPAVGDRLDDFRAQPPLIASG